MKTFRALIFVAAFAVCAPAHAQWQTPTHSVPIGKGGGVTGFDSALPGTAGRPLVSNGAGANPSFQDLAPDIAAGTGITITGTHPAVIAANPLDSAACVVRSRAQAITLNLTSCTSVQTLSYATAGDGGGATFKKVVAVAYTDTYITTAALAGGSGYVNGSYNGVPLSRGCTVKATVSGGAVTAISVLMPCSGFSVGAIISAPNIFLGGTGSGFTYTVTDISLPGASFTDSAGNHFQFAPNGEANANQFGCVGDWAGSDGSATNNHDCILSISAWANNPISSASASVSGNSVYFPRGSYMICGTTSMSGGTAPFSIPIPQGTRFHGGGYGVTTIRECTTNPSGIHLVELCNSNAQAGEFGCSISEMTLDSTAIAGSTNSIAVVHSKVGQQFVLGQNLNVLGGNKGCVFYEEGRGGAANDIWLGVNCVIGGTQNPGFVFNAASAQHILRDSPIACTTTGQTAIAHSNGRLVADGLDIEGCQYGLSQNVPSSITSSYRNIQESSDNCSGAVLLGASNTPGNTLFENISTACPITIINGQSGGTNFTGVIVKQITCVSGACS